LDGTDHYQRAVEIFREVGLVRNLGLELVEVTERTAVAAVTVDERHGNYLGGLHGGVVSTLVDTVAFFPGMLLPSGRKLTTEGLSVHYFRPAGMGERVTATAEVLRMGRRMGHVLVSVGDGQGRRLAHGYVTLLTL